MLFFMEHKGLEITYNILVVFETNIKYKPIMFENVLNENSVL